jgi:hypothetical protein
MVAVKAIPALLAMAVSALAAPSDPGETAVHFLEKVRTNNLNLEPGIDTALSPHTSEKKRKEIARRLERMASDLGNDPLEVGSVKLDGDLAAVLVRKIGGFDPSRLQVFPVALVKRGAEWAAAPVPASFENSGVGYAATLRKRLESLENWMLQERVVDLENLREQSAAGMRRKIEEVLSPDELRQMSSKQVGERFLTACEHRKLPEILGLLGGLAAQLPDDWELRLRTADLAISGTSPPERPWRLLIAPEVLRVPIFHEDDGDIAVFSIACLDPASHPSHTDKPKVELVHLGMSKTPDGFWRIDPPAGFLQGAATADDESDDDELDGDLLDMFPAKLALKFPVAPEPTASQAKDALIAALGGERPDAWTRLIRIHGDPSDVRLLFSRAARIWWDSKNPSAARRAVSLAMHEKGDRAVAACQFFNSRLPDRLDLGFLYFEKSPMGWLWDPVPSEETRKSFQEWTDGQPAIWQDSWQETMLTECAKLGEIPETAAPTEEQARKLIETWIQANRTGDVMAALRLTARLDMPDSQITALRNIGYEMAGTLLNRHNPTITGIHRGNIWTAVGTRTDPDGKLAFPLYPLVSTPLGPRILLEVHLLSAGRSRDFLNSESLKRLRKSSAPAADELGELLKIHQTEIAGTNSP